MSRARRQEEGPLVTVVVPCWNAQTTLAETLRSVANQTHRHLEIIIVDDGSTDRTAEVAESFCGQDGRARLIRKANGGVASARNRAIADAKGEWIAPIDADDLWHPTRVEKQLAAALAAPEQPGFVYCWYRLIDEAGRIVGSGPRRRIEGRAFRQLAYVNVVENGSALLALRKAVQEVGGYDEGLRAELAQGCEDVMVQLRIARQYPIAVAPEYLVGWRRHGRNMSTDFSQIARSCRLVYRRLADEKAPVPRRVARQVRATSAFAVAEQQAVAGNYGAASIGLADAVRLDPVRSGLLLAYRAVRSLRRRLGGSGPAMQPRPFFDAGPTELLAGDPHALPGFLKLIERLERRRLELLAAADTSEVDRR